MKKAASLTKKLDKKVRSKTSALLHAADVEGVEDKLLTAMSSTAQGKQFKKHKYNVSAKSGRTVDGIVFDSKWEMQVYMLLKQHIPAHHLHQQPEFLLQPKFRDVEGKMQRSISYVGDFLLGPPRPSADSPLLPEHVLIDCKGMETDVFRLKLKMFMFKFGGTIHRPRTNQASRIHDFIAKYKELNEH